MKDLVIIRGAGDIASGVIHKLYQCGFSVIAIEISEPTAIRRWVSFSEAVYEKKSTIEGVDAVNCETAEEIEDNLKSKIIVITDEKLIHNIKSKHSVYIDCTLRKHEVQDILKSDIIIGVGPGFRAGDNAHAVVESQRGHNLGRVIYKGEAQPDTKIPGNIGGYTIERVLKSPADGVIKVKKTIGDVCEADEVVASVDNHDIRVPFKGLLRGMLREDTHVSKGMKIGDIDPRVDEIKNCSTISDKARCIAGGVLEAIMHLKGSL